MKRTYSHDGNAHRKLKMVPHFDNPQAGADVKELQKAINKRINNLKLPVQKLKVDGKCGRQTIASGRRVLRHLGVGHKGDGLSIYGQRLIRHPEKRTKAQVHRGQQYREDHIKPAPKVNGNTVSGGSSDRERITAACEAAMDLYSSGKSHRFYSQPGTWTVELGITGEHAGQRSDCSQFATSMYHSAGAPDPNGQNFGGGFTGTLAGHGKRISREQLQPGDLVIYGWPSTHHVEVWVGNGDGKTSYAELDRAGSSARDRTCGHGSPPVDAGDIDMMSGAGFFASL